MNDNREKKSSFGLVLTNFWTKTLGGKSLEKKQNERLIEMIDHARTFSPYYQKLYQNLPENIKDINILPVTRKKELMQNFDDWITDRNLSFEQVQSFVQDSSNIGRLFKEKYTVATTSGTTGIPGIFLMDDYAMSVTNSIALRMLTSWLGLSDVLKFLRVGKRFAMIMAKNGHYASSIAAVRMAQKLGDKFLALSAHQPLPDLVNRLNKFNPALLAPYASMASLLATEQEKGKLNINPVLITVSAEGLAQSEYKRIAETFGARVGNSYASTECPFLSYSCKEGWLHVNSDWVVVEPVDKEYKPVQPGVQSHSVLITNLANRIQPIIRYDLGDSIILKPEPCFCGNKLPAIKVTGRSSDVLTFQTSTGELTSIPPLAFSIMVDNIHGIERVQVVQTEPNALRVRLRYDGRLSPEEVSKNVAGAIRMLLDERNLHNVFVVIGDEPPEQSKAGKFREVIPLKRG